MKSVLSFLLFSGETQENVVLFSSRMEKKNDTVKSLGTGGQFCSGLEDAEAMLSVLKQNKITIF